MTVSTSTTTMRAGVLHAPGDLRIEDRPVPVPTADEVLVRVTLNGLCGTDATEYSKGPMMVPLERQHPGSGHVGPTILGHEFMGTVVDAGHNARRLVGRRVVSGAGVSCGRCAWCTHGRTNLCASYYTLGLSTHGGLANYVAVPAGTCFEVPEGCMDQDAALVQPLAVGMHAVRRAGLRPGQDVLLLGAGAIGSFVLAGLSRHDGRVVAADVARERLEAAKALGASHTVLIDTDAGDEQFDGLFPDGAPVVFETSGVPGSAARALRLAARGGTVVLVGLTSTPQPLELAPVVLREVDIRTTVAHVCAVDVPDALSLLAERPLAAVIVGDVVPLERVVPDGLEALVAGRAPGKVLVDLR